MAVVSDARGAAARRNGHWACCGRTIAATGSGRRGRARGGLCATECPHAGCRRREGTGAGGSSGEIDGFVRIAFAAQAFDAFPIAETTAVPEPATLLLISAGLAASRARTRRTRG